MKMKTVKQISTFLTINLFIIFIFGCNNPQNNQNKKNTDNVLNLDAEFQHYRKKHNIEDYNNYYIDSVGFISLPKFLTIKAGLINIIADNYVIEQVKRTVGSYYAIFKNDNPIFILTINTALADELTYFASHEAIDFNEAELSELDSRNRKSMDELLVINNLSMGNWEKTKWVKYNEQNTIVSSYTYTRTDYPDFRAVSYKFLNNSSFYEIECICLEKDFIEYNAVFETISRSFLMKNCE